MLRSTRQSKSLPVYANGKTAFNQTPMNCLRLFILLFVAVLAGCASNGNQYTANKKSYSAADTSRTVDLTHPPQDMWDRIRRGFAIPNLHSDLVDEWTAYYASHPQSVYTM